MIFEIKFTKLLWPLQACQVDELPYLENVVDIAESLFEMDKYWTETRHYFCFQCTSWERYILSFHVLISHLKVNNDRDLWISGWTLDRFKCTARNEDSDTGDVLNHRMWTIVLRARNQRGNKSLKLNSQFESSCISYTWSAAETTAKDMEINHPCRFIVGTSVISIGQKKGNRHFHWLQGEGVNLNHQGSSVTWVEGVVLISSPSMNHRIDQ